MLREVLALASFPLPITKPRCLCSLQSRETSEPGKPYPEHSQTHINQAASPPLCYRAGQHQALTPPARGSRSQTPVGRSRSSCPGQRQPQGQGTKGRSSSIDPQVRGVKGEHLLQPCPALLQRFPQGYFQSRLNFQKEAANTAVKIPSMESPSLSLCAWGGTRSSYLHRVSASDSKVVKIHMVGDIGRITQIQLVSRYLQPST